MCVLRGGRVRLSFRLLPKYPCQCLKAGAPLIEVIIVLLKVYGERVDGAERLGHGAVALISVRGEGVVRWGRVVHVVLFQTLVDEISDVGAVLRDRLPGTPFYFGFDVPAVQVLFDHLGISERPHVKRVRVLLAASFIVVVDHVISDVLFGRHEGFFFLLPSQAHVEDHDNWGKKTKISHQTTVNRNRMHHDTFHVGEVGGGGSDWLTCVFNQSEPLMLRIQD